MMCKHAPIGVMDSGLGGLSVVSALREILPYEDIIYYGDTANCPYGNKTKEELLSLSRTMLTFLQQKQVKCVALACNTTSALADLLRSDFSMPIITVAECAADAIGKMDLDRVGLLATVSTAKSEIYKTRIQAVSPAVQVFSHGSVNLARLVEENHPTSEHVDAEIRSCMDALLNQDTINDVILGCTHYPLVKDRFELLYPNIRFMDPAPHQAAFLKHFLDAEKAENEEHKPSLSIYTTGTIDAFRDVCAANGLSEHYHTSFYQI